VWSRRIVALASTALASGILYLGVPRAVGGMVKLPGDRVIDMMRGDRSVTGQDISVLADSRERTLGFFSSRQMWGELGLARLIAALGDGVDEEARRNGVGQAVSAIENGLALAPNDGYSWARLAIARYYLDGPGSSVADALIQSILIAEYDRRLVFDRLDVAFAVWDYLGPDARDLTRRQIAYAYGVSWKGLRNLATTPERRVRIIAALSDSSGRMEEFEAYLRRAGT
jgi:hypothetical protein